ncbi:MAG: RNA polymerase sigma factor SigJ [Pseudomonadota bacterium]|nr:RNA polymerase sigma factor SigJ [Pseudomonadota bacterium]
MSRADDTFEAERARLTGIAYRMLGEMAAAEDVVQEAWLRWQKSDRDGVRDPHAFLSTVTVRLALDALRAARTRREHYVGPWLPEPLLPDDMRAFAPAPDARAELASDLSIALLHVLERLSPEERAAFILHDAFDCDYPEIAAMLGKNEAACRKLVSRARGRVRKDRPRYAVSAEAHREILRRFAQASAAADTATLANLLAPDVIAYADGGGKATAALRPIRGADKVTRFFVGVAKKATARFAFTLQLAEFNGQPALLMLVEDRIDLALSIETDGLRITRVYVMRNPEKLGRVTHALL